MRHYLNSCLEADFCTQLLDDIGKAVKNIDELFLTLRKTFTCFRKSFLKLTPEKFVIGMQKIKFLGNVIIPEEISPERTKIDEFLKKNSNAENNKTS